MNQDQLNSLIRSVLKIGGGVLAAHGLTAYSDLINSQDVVGVILTVAGLVLSHINHSPSSSGGSSVTGSKTALLLALLLPVLMFTGCESAPTVAYKAVDASDITVTAAMTAWGDYVAQNHPPASQELAVEAAFEKVQQAELAAIDATALAMSVTGTNKLTLQTALVQANYTAADNAMSELIALLTQLGVKL